MKVLVVIEDCGLNGAGVLGVFTEERREAAEALVAAAPGQGFTGYSGTWIDEFEVDALPNMNLTMSEVKWRRRVSEMRAALDKWEALGGKVER